MNATPSNSILPPILTFSSRSKSNGSLTNNGRIFPNSNHDQIVAAHEPSNLDGSGNTCRFYNTAENSFPSSHFRLTAVVDPHMRYETSSASIPTTPNHTFVNNESNQMYQIYTPVHSLDAPAPMLIPPAPKTGFLSPALQTSPPNGLNKVHTYLMPNERTHCSPALPPFPLQVVNLPSGPYLAVPIQQPDQPVALTASAAATALLPRQPVMSNQTLASCSLPLSVPSNGVPNCSGPPTNALPVRSLVVEPQRAHVVAISMCPTALPRPFPFQSVPALLEPRLTLQSSSAGFAFAASSFLPASLSAALPNLDLAMGVGPERADLSVASGPNFVSHAKMSSAGQQQQQQQQLYLPEMYNAAAMLDASARLFRDEAVALNGDETLARIVAARNGCAAQFCGADSLSANSATLHSSEQDALVTLNGESFLQQMTEQPLPLSLDQLDSLDALPFPSAALPSAGACAFGELDAFGCPTLLPPPNQSPLHAPVPPLECNPFGEPGIDTQHLFQARLPLHAPASVAQLDRLPQQLHFVLRSPPGGAAVAGGPLNSALPLHILGLPPPESNALPLDAAASVFSVPAATVLNSGFLSELILPESAAAGAHAPHTDSAAAASGALQTASSASVSASANGTPHTPAEHNASRRHNESQSQSQQQNSSNDGSPARPRRKYRPRKPRPNANRSSATAFVSSSSSLPSEAATEAVAAAAGFEMYVSPPVGQNSAELEIDSGAQMAAAARTPALCSAPRFNQTRAQPATSGSALVLTGQLTDASASSAASVSCAVLAASNSLPLPEPEARSANTLDAAGSTQQLQQGTLKQRPPAPKKPRRPPPKARAALAAQNASANMPASTAAAAAGSGTCGAAGGEPATATAVAVARTASRSGGKSRRESRTRRAAAAGGASGEGGGGSGGGSAEAEGPALDTRRVADEVSASLRAHSIPQSVFAARVLRRAQGTLSDLLRNPKPWHKLKAGRETFRRMHAWLQQPGARLRQPYRAIYSCTVL